MTVTMNMTMAIMICRGRCPSLTARTTLFFFCCFLILCLAETSNANTSSNNNPKSKPYVAYRTNPFDQPTVTTWVMKDGIEKSATITPTASGGGGGSGERKEGGEIHKNEVNRRNSNKSSTASSTKEEDVQRSYYCPLSFRLGSTRQQQQHHAGSESSISGNGGGPIARSSPVIYPLHPDFDAGSGRQILLATTWEMLEMWTPGSGGGGDGAISSSSSSSEQLKEDEQFPLLFEGSSFYHTSPIVYDVAGDGIMDAILGDYDGELHLIGLDFEHDGRREQQQQGNNDRNRRRKRYYERISVPRLAVRKAWYDAAIGKEADIYNNASAVLTSSSSSSSSSSGSPFDDPNRTREEFMDPYHTYFEQSNKEWRTRAAGEEGQHPLQPLQGVSADVLTMGIDTAKALADRRRRQGRRKLKNSPSDEEDMTKGVANNEGVHRRLQEEELNMVVKGQVDAAREEQKAQEQNGEGGQDLADGEIHNEEINDATQGYHEDDGLFHDDAREAPPDGTESTEDREFARNWGDDIMMRNEGEVGDNSLAGATGTDEIGYKSFDDYYPYGEHGYVDDGYKPLAPEGWDTYAQYQEAKDAYFHDSNYLHLPPHLLSTCTVAELPREYVSESMKPSDAIDELILCAVSYYFDEDEDRAGRAKSFGKHANTNGGDETEEQRGRYVANAILGYHLKWKYWSLTEVLDLSTDWSAPLGDLVEGGTAGLNSDAHGGMGAWALATPVAVKLDGTVRNHIVVGTSMGLVYALDAGTHSIKNGWPVQLRHPIEQKVVVEDVVGNTNLEVFVVDSGGDIVSLNSDGIVLWSRSLLTKAEIAHVVRGTSPMSLGDVEGAGGLAIVLLARIVTTDRLHINQPQRHNDVLEYRLYAIDASTGDDLPHFPMALAEGWSNTSHTMPLPQPLLIDLHEDQHHWLDRIRGQANDDVAAIRAINAAASNIRNINDSLKPRPHGGSGRGLHIVQPLGSILHLIEGSTSCEQTIDVGNTIPSMVQADDVHGTGGLDLVVTTSQGEILTLESDVVPYHPLNVWSAGVARAPGSGNAQAHGFSSSQGIFVHPISRQFRDILGIYIPITFEIFDRRPSINDEVDRRVYQVEIRAGMSAKRAVYWHVYDAPGVYTERIQIPYGPGYYSFAVRLRTTHGIVYEDSFHIGWNVNYMGGLWMIVCLPLILAAIPILMFKRNPNWQDEDYGGVRGVGILGRAPPS